jgi:hypothetical protein
MGRIRQFARPVSGRWGDVAPGHGQGQLYLQDRSATPRQGDRLSDRHVADTVNSMFSIVGPQTLRSRRLGMAARTTAQCGNGAIGGGRGSSAIESLHTRSNSKRYRDSSSS